MLYNCKLWRCLINYSPTDLCSVHDLLAPLFTYRIMVLVEESMRKEMTWWVINCPGTAQGPVLRSLILLYDKKERRNGEAVCIKNVAAELP